KIIVFNGNRAMIEKRKHDAMIASCFCILGKGDLLRFGNPYRLYKSIAMKGINNVLSALPIGHF
ncbi:hypothetical protein ABTP08_19605, partial [Acinetobacter baumannii]